MSRRICLIEDDAIMGEALALRFEMEGLDCDWHKTARSALAALRRQAYDVVVSDIALPDLSGEALYLALLDDGSAPPPFIFMTGHGTVDQAVRLLKRGAVDYLLKPFAPDLLLGKLKTLLTRQDSGHSDVDVLGISPAMRALEDLLSRLAQSQASVLITGESGVGKERVALKLHALQGAGRPFVACTSR